MLGTAGPQWGRDYTQSAAPGRDLVVVLDCSRSMFAETPRRLQRAKTALLDLVEAVKHQGGHRLALVVFAGRARLACPLTHDYDHFRTAGESVDTNAPTRNSNPALAPFRARALARRSMKRCWPTTRAGISGAHDILLLSDGDDPAHDGECAKGQTRRTNRAYRFTPSV